jgi:4-hydroxybenzoate polyprenyltransferase
MAPILSAAGLIIGWAAGGFYYLLGYAVVSLSYSWKAKEFPLLDVFMLSALYALRLFAGGDVSGHPVSFWLLAFSSFFFLSLAIIKRVAELGKTQNARRGYFAADVQLLQAIGIGASLVSSNLLALYVQSDFVAKQYANPKILWLIVPLILFWQCRLWLSTARGYMRDDPIVYAAKDWVSWLVGVALVAVVLISFVRL